MFVLTAFTLQSRTQKIGEIDVERINVIEKGAKLKMVISNCERQHPGVFDGKTLARTRPPGMLFFNEKGDECERTAASGQNSSSQIPLVTLFH